MMEGEIHKLIFVFTINVVALCYSYYISSKLPKGIYRFISLLPVFYLFTILPLFLTSRFASAATNFFFTWLGNFKLILFAFDHGPLYPMKSLIHFITIGSLPVQISKNISHDRHEKGKSESSQAQRQEHQGHSYSYMHKMFSYHLGTRMGPIKFLGFPILIELVCNHKQNLNPHYILLSIYIMLIYFVVEYMVLVLNTVAWIVLGVDLDLPFNEPYLATSLQDFWGRRWNLTVSNILRHTIFKPIINIFSNKDWAPFSAVMASFLVSGLMHELFFYYVTRVNPTWEIASYFMLQGICVVVELLAKRALAGTLVIPVAVSRLFTVGFVVVTSFWLFFPPLIRSNADVKAIEEFKLLVYFAKTIVTKSLKCSKCLFMDSYCNVA
ncbi:putative long-chain-alcohol O-fatty-acyltransferase 3 [Artemisia annua]|uniref:Putative long-chain-alcohol O-fatty-acyltransferase 3 n=1 Tax=Artemisia annua TaxID=35608 RepID=A0A2U1NMM7_ARTAN|nr:putative long-chain-alcohol O-fatty-acyltransferase 3 [Artemisia annua]